MKMKLNGGFGVSRNVVPVIAENTGSQPWIVGDMHMLRRSGWRGGPTYQFHPNEYGEALGLKAVIGMSVRQILDQLAVSVTTVTRALSPNVAQYRIGRVLVRG